VKEGKHKGRMRSKEKKTKRVEENERTNTNKKKEKNTKRVEENERTNISLTPRPSLKKSVILKNDLLLVFQKRRLRLDTKSKCQYDSEVLRQKQSY
jgi:hypothetical protein